MTEDQDPDYSTIETETVTFAWCERCGYVECECE